VAIAGSLHKKDATPAGRRLVELTIGWGYSRS
jgi:hypothetical protein